MKASSREYLRGAASAHHELQSGRDPDGCRSNAEDAIGSKDLCDFDRGYLAQLDQWPERIETLPPYYLDLDHADGDMSCALFIGVMVLATGLAVAGYKHFSGPLVGVLVIVAVLSGIAAYRNQKP